MLPEQFIYLGIFINIIGLSSYFIDTIKGRIKPNRVSFVIWALAPLVIFFAQLQQGVGASSLMTLSTGLLPLFAILADVLATLPTLVKAYRFPTTEATWPWLAISANGFFTLLTVKTWNFAH